MKCVKCGTELAADAKFCGECGTKVERGVFCPECGAKVAPGAKFCGECGYKLSSATEQKSTDKVEQEDERLPESEPDSGEEPSAICEIDWDGKAKIAEFSMALDDAQVTAIKVDMECLRETDNAKADRILLSDEAGFEEKFAAFKSVYEERIGVNCGEFPFFQDSCLIGLVDNSKAGTGKRGTLFTRLGMVVIDGDFPAAVEGKSPLSGIVPWKLFYIFSEPADDFYRLMKPVVASKSDKVDEAIRSALEEDIDKPNGRYNLLFRYNNVGVDKDDVAEFIDGIKTSLSSSRDETESNCTEEEEEEEED